MHRNIILRFNRECAVLFLFWIVVVFSQFRIEERQGSILIITELICALLIVMNKKRESIKINRVCLIYIFFVLYRLLHLLLTNVNRMSEIKSLIVKEIGIFFLFYLLLNRISCISLIKWMRNFGVIMGILGCYEFFTKTSIFSKLIAVESRVIMQDALGTYGARVRLIFIHPIICAAYLVFFFLCLIYVPYSNNKINLMAGTCLLFSLAGTQSRSSWISFFVVAFLFVILEKKAIVFKLDKNKMFSIMAGILGFGLIYVMFKTSLDNMFYHLYERWAEGLNAENSANYNRVSMIKMGIKIWLDADWKNKIIGFGDGYSLAYLKMHAIRGWNIAVDNQYVTLLVDYGLWGVGFAVEILVCSVIKFFCAKEKIHRCGYAMLIALWISTFFYEMLTWTYITILISISILLTGGNDEIKIKNDM